MKRIFLSGAGFTMVELLLAALFSLMVIASLYGFFREQLFTLLSQEVKIATLEDARGALDIMVRELRNAGAWGTGAVPVTVPGGSTLCSRVVIANATTIQVQMDTRGAGADSAPDGDCSGPNEDLTYSLVAGNTATCPGPNHITRNTQCLVGNIPGTTLFTYFDSTNTQLATSPPVSIIKRVQITFTVDVPDPTPWGKAAGGTIRSTLSSSVEFRN